MFEDASTGIVLGAWTDVRRLGGLCSPAEVCNGIESSKRRRFDTSANSDKSVFLRATPLIGFD
jgi:hypothetical protein